MNQPELLLRDIHLPEPVSWWPPAPGWWMLVVAVCALVAMVYGWRRLRLKKYHAPAAIAGRELARLQLAWREHQDTRKLLQEISVWLRRASMSLTSRREAASLTGGQWQDFLDDLAGEAIFSEIDVRLITETLYQPVRPDNSGETDSQLIGNAANQPALPNGTRVDGEYLLALCQRWLNASARRAKSK